MDQSLTRGERIRKNSDIQTIRLKGRKYSIKPFLIYRCPNPQGPRVAIAVTKKSGGSVVRNRAKRKIRELFRRNKRIFGDFDYFFFTSRDLTKLMPRDWEEIFQSILRCFSPS